MWFGKKVHVIVNELTIRLPTICLLHNQHNVLQDEGDNVLIPKISFTSLPSIQSHTTPPSVSFNT